MVMILFTELNFYFKIEPFASWYFPIIWFGYIFLVDAIIYKLKGHSLIMSRKEQFVKALLLSALIWWIFELINLKTLNWNYGINTYGRLFSLFGIIKASIAFSTVLPAVIETLELVKTFKFINHVKLIEHHKITYKFLRGMIYIGAIMLILTVESFFLFFFYNLLENVCIRDRNIVYLIKRDSKIFWGRNIIIIMNCVLIPLFVC